MAWLWLLPSLLLLLACLPVGLAFEVGSVPSWHATARVSWAWIFHTRISLSSGGSRADRQRGPVAASRPRAQRRSPRISAIPPALGLLLELGRKLLAATKLGELRVYARAGLDDPADTGVLYGALAPLLALLATREQRSCTFEPEFTRSCFEISACGRVVLVPARYLLVIAGFLLKPRAWRVARQLAN